VFRCQFNTCAVHLHNNTDAEGDFFRQLTFAAAELDVICEGAWVYYDLLPANPRPPSLAMCWGCVALARPPESYFLLGCFCRHIIARKTFIAFRRFVRRSACCRHRLRRPNDRRSHTFIIRGRSRRRQCTAEKTNVFQRR
jgi:hypothetical protein